MTNKDLSESNADADLLAAKKLEDERIAKEKAE
jgi:hypothetical protein